MLESWAGLEVQRTGTGSCPPYEDLGLNFKDLQGVESSDYGNNSVQGRSAKEVKIAKRTLSLFSCEQPGIKSQNKREKEFLVICSYWFYGDMASCGGGNGSVREPGRESGLILKPGTALETLPTDGERGNWKSQKKEFPPQPCSQRVFVILAPHSPGSSKRSGRGILCPTIISKTKFACTMST